MKPSPLTNSGRPPIQTDREAKIEYARALAWNGQLGDAESMYAQLASTGNANAKKGLARVIGWRGDLDRSEETWRQVLVTDPNDVEALTGLAQVLSWQGRQGDAESALQHALRTNPSYGDARALMRLVQADLRPNVTVSAIGTNDSDDNRSTSLQLDYLVRAPWNGSIGARYSERWANFALTDSRADAGNIFARWQPAGSSWQLRADAGVTHHYSNLVPAFDPQKTIVNGGLRVVGKPGSLPHGRPACVPRSFRRDGAPDRQWRRELRVCRRSGDCASGAPGVVGRRQPCPAHGWRTRQFAKRILVDASLDAQSPVEPCDRSDGSSDTIRHLPTATLRRRNTRSPKSAVALVWAEISAGTPRAMWASVSRRSTSLDRAPAQELAERVALTAGYRFDPSHEFSASAGYANVAGPGQTTGSEYTYRSFALRARVGF